MISSKYNIAMLVEQVKSLHFRQLSDFSKLCEIFEIIFLELQILRDKFIHKIKIKSKMVYVYEAEQDIILSLIALLHEKFNDFLAKVIKEGSDNDT